MTREIRYSKTEMAFTFSDVHGPFTKKVPDPAWQRPVIEVPDESATPPIVNIRNPRIPDDSVVVSEEDYAALMKAQAEGMWIRPDENGYPVIVTPPDEVFAGRVRTRRAALLADADLLTQPDRWESYTPERKAAISAYKQALRDITTQPGFPREVVWPELPE